MGYASIRVIFGRGDFEMRDSWLDPESHSELSSFSGNSWVMGFAREGVFTDRFCLC